MGPFLSHEGRGGFWSAFQNCKANGCAGIGSAATLAFMNKSEKQDIWRKKQEKNRTRRLFRTCSRDEDRRASR